MKSKISSISIPNSKPRNPVLPQMMRRSGSGKHKCKKREAKNNGNSGE